MLWSAGQRFFKMSGSGNDFVFFDGVDVDTSPLETRASVARICARGTGVGADGVVVLGRPADGEAADLAIRYYNADGSRASLCGNATLCAASLAVRLGRVDPAGFAIATDAGVVRADVRDGVPGFSLPPVTDACGTLTTIPFAEGEQDIGYATVGVPHVVIRVPDLAVCDVTGRGRSVRNHSALQAGANVNFVAPSSRGDGSWAIRTYERGVEGETLACGTGSVASAILLHIWGKAKTDATTELTTDVALQTRSGAILTVSCSQEAGGGAWLPFLRGEGRLVFTGELGSP